MSVPVVLVLALAPAVFWFWFFVRHDNNPEPAALLLRTFGWGAVALVPAALLQELAMPLGPLIGLALSGPIEELCKYAAAASLLRHREFDEPVDGLVYATAAALGFATLENALYLAAGGPQLILVRGPVTTLAHVLFAAAWGYAMALKRFGGGAWTLRRGLLLAAGLHAAFNLVLQAGGRESPLWLLIPVVPGMAIVWLRADRFFRHARSGLGPARFAGRTPGARGRASHEPEGRALP